MNLKIKKIKQNAEWVKNNKEYLAEHRKNRRIGDLSYKLTCYLRTRVNHAIRVQNGDKNIKTTELIGCSISFLKCYLESKFNDGMTWENYGKKGWHIDHILPCASFDLTIEENQRKCFHYTNLQFLWWYDNLFKSDKIIVITSQELHNI